MTPFEQRPPGAGAADARVRIGARVEGTVQGVGFRPFVYRLAREFGLGGFVLNDDRGVLLEVEGDATRTEEFFAQLQAEAPPLAKIERITRTGRPLNGERTFAIRASERHAGRDSRADAPVTPDSATCEDCLRELADPRDRRFRYPFINCTNCGPRFTIVKGVPYDRTRTTMAAFTMCAACQAEYEDPGDRRFHAQPNACPECGPTLALVDPANAPQTKAATGDEALTTAAEALKHGAIVAVKGIGGYHLACRADDERAVARLRARKHREERPFALMAATLEQAEQLVHLTDAERELLRSTARPIVLARRRAQAPVAQSVAPDAPELGVMLPYSPLHHLLLADAAAGALVMTSGNRSDEPIAFRDADATARLEPIADLLLVHDRPIETRTDDSVVRAVRLADNHQATRQFIRRSRGYVPASLSLPGGAAKPLLACGAELKHTFCLARGERAWVSHHIGDLQNYETLTSFTTGVEHFERLFDVIPELIAHDLHPDYLSTCYAQDRQGVEHLAVQHHHAHLAACLAEHGFAPDTRAVGAIFDGTGYGTDGTVWGGEILVGGAQAFERVAWLRPVPMPGGERAIHEPWRMACAWLDAATDGDPDLPGRRAGQVAPDRWRQILNLARTGINSPATSSAGRLFDAVAALCGIRPQVGYEGQAAIELEAACDPAERGAYPIPQLDPREAIEAITADLDNGVAVATVAARFHNGLAEAVVEACTKAASRTQLVVLSGGVFQNRRLLEATAAGLGHQGLHVLTPTLLPAGDGGISYGQAAVAAAALGR